eukprot:gene35725-51077_t
MARCKRCGSHHHLEWGSSDPNMQALLGAGAPLSAPPKPGSGRGEERKDEGRRCRPFAPEETDAHHHHTAGRAGGANGSRQ